MKITKSVTYKEPIIQRSRVGSKPRFEFNQDPQVQNPYVPCSGDRCDLGAQTVWRDVPLKNPDGSPRMREVTKEFDLTPRSPLKYGLIGGSVGAALGALGGYLGSNSLAMTAGKAALVGALMVGSVVGAGAALAVYGDQTRLVWDTHQIIDHEMKGYHEYVGLGESNGQSGFFHRYIADVEESVLGTYTTPRVEHYKEVQEPKQ